jgi:hypothetical protein
VARPIIKDASLENFYAWGEPMGYRFQIYQNRYRNVPLSCIEKFVLTVDGEEVPNIYVHFCLNGKKFMPKEIKDMYNEYWAMQDAATIEVDKIGGLSEGEHDIKVYMVGRSAYIPCPFYVTDPDHQPHTYRTGDIGGSARLALMR